MRHFVSQGIILRKQTSGENDYFLTIFCPELGRIQALSRGSRKISNQTGFHLDVLNLCDFQFYKNGSSHLLTECRVEKAFQTIKNDLQKSLYAITATEIILKSFQDDQESQQLYILLKNFLNNLENSHQHQLLLEEFKIKTLNSAGSWPDISTCHFCLNKWTTEHTIYTDQLGQLTCQNCLSLNHNQLKHITFNTVKLAHFLAKHPLEQFNLTISAQELFNLQTITSIFLDNYLQQEVKSSRLLQSANP